MARSLVDLPGGSLPSNEAPPRAAALAELVPRGRVVELSGAVARGRLTLAVGFVLRAQREGELCAWVQREKAGLFPPDLARAGVDLGDLIIVHTPRPAGANAVARAAELLLRSGGFGLAVLDLVGGLPRGEAWVQRLGGLARRHGARVLLLTSQRAEGSSAGALVAVRVEPRRRVLAGAYVIDPAVLRDRCDLARVAAATTHTPPWEAHP